MTNLNIATPIDKNDVNFGQSDHTGVSVANYQPNLRGGQNRTAYDKYLSDNNFRSQLGKGVEELSIDHVRKCTQKIKDCKPLYYQIWSAIV